MYEPSLFIPGPTEVFPDVRAQLARPVISHRGSEISKITFEIFENLKKVFRTKNDCFVATSSGTGVMEGAIRNLVKKRVLGTVCGYFSELQWKVATKNGKPTDAYSVESGHEIDPSEVDRRLSTGAYDTLTVVHSETSTGVMNDVAAIAAVTRKYPDVFLIVDTVSSLAGAPVDVDAWGADVVFASSQKCLALPPGLAVFTVSPRAMKRAETITDRGHYHDFLNYKKMGEKGQIPATCAVSLMYALQYQLQRILAETLEARFARHIEMATIVRSRISKHFDLFPKSRQMTPSESVFTNRPGVEVAKIVDSMKAKGKLFGNGYGDLKEKTFRIGHMGDLTVDHMLRFLDLFEESLAELGYTR